MTGGGPRAYQAGRERGHRSTRDDREPVVHLWAGWADPGRTRAWQQNTLTNVWSTTKAMTSLCAHVLMDRGELDPDAPVVRYWPEFAAGGKSGILSGRS